MQNKQKFSFYPVFFLSHFPGQYSRKNHPEESGAIYNFLLFNLTFIEHLVLVIVPDSRCEIK